MRKSGENPFLLDSQRPKIRLKDYAYNELRYRILRHTKPDIADGLMSKAQEAIDQKWQVYEEMALGGAHTRG